MDGRAAQSRLRYNRALAVAGKPPVKDLSRGVCEFRRALGLPGGGHQPLDRCELLARPHGAINGRHPVSELVKDAGESGSRGRASHGVNLAGPSDFFVLFPRDLAFFFWLKPVH